jgi:hypothetical protein
MNTIRWNNKSFDPMDVLPPGSARIVLRTARRGACFSAGVGACLRAVRAVSSASRGRVIAL